MKKFVNGRSIFLVSLVLTVILFYALSQNFFLTNYLKIEQIQNEKHINNLLTHINTEISQIQKVGNAFVINGYNISQEDTIEQLGLDFIFYENKKEQTTFSQFNHENSDLSAVISEKSNFLKKLLDHFHTLSNTEDIFIFNQHIFYLVKKRLDTQRSLYFGKLLSTQSLNKLSEDFEQLFIDYKQFKHPTLKLSTKFIPNIQVNTSHNNGQISNIIAFYNLKDDYLFSIHTINQRKYVNEGRRTIQIVNVIMAVFLAIILYVIYKSQIVFRRMLQKDKKALEIKVEKRTNQLEELLKKLKASNEQLHYLAYSDPLTKTHNRRSFFIESEKLMKKAMNKKQPLSLVMIDIDNFKQINDKYGHNVGDKVLVAFASMIKDEISSKDIFGRLGGEEFAIVFANMTLDEASKKVDMLRKMVSNLEVNIKENQHVKFTASFGLNDNKNSHDLDAILKGADELLYSAKNTGKNTVRSRINQTALWCDLY